MTRVITISALLFRAAQNSEACRWSKAFSSRERVGRQRKQLGNTAEPRYGLEQFICICSHLKDSGKARKLRAQDRGEHPSEEGTPGRKAIYLGEDEAKGCGSETRVE